MVVAHPQPRLHPLTLAALAPLTWGTTYFVLEHLRPMGPVTAAMLRALGAGLLLLLIVRKLPKGDWWWKSFLLGFFNFGLFFSTLFISAARLTGGVAATLGAVGPLLIIGFNLWYFQRKPNRHTFFAALLGLVGVALLVLGPGARMDSWGIIAGIISVFAASGGYILSKEFGTPPQTSLLAVTAWQLTWGGLMLLPVALLSEGVPPALHGPQWLLLAYLIGIGTALAYALWFRGIQQSSPVQVSLLTRISPATAIVIDLLQGRTLSLVQWAGLGLIALSFMPEREKRRQGV